MPWWYNQIQWGHLLANLSAHTHTHTHLYTNTIRHITCIIVLWEAITEEVVGVQSILTLVLPLRRRERARGQREGRRGWTEQGEVRGVSVAVVTVYVFLKFTTCKQGEAQSRWQVKTLNCKAKKHSLILYHKFRMLVSFNQSLQSCTGENPLTSFSSLAPCCKYTLA